MSSLFTGRTRAIAVQFQIRGMLTPPSWNGWSGSLRQRFRRWTSPVAWNPLPGDSVLSRFVLSDGFGQAA